MLLDLDPAWAGIVVSPYLRMYEYAAGDFFQNHVDLPQKVGLDWTTHTLVVCLAGAYDGGALALESRDGAFVERVELQPAEMVIFDHGTLHQVEPIKAGSRTVVRTDLARVPVSQVSKASATNRKRTPRVLRHSRGEMG